MTITLRQSTTRDGSPVAVLDDGQRRYLTALSGGVPQIGRRTDVRDWLGINIQCVPYQEIDRRKRAGLPSLLSEHHLGERAHTYHPASLARHEDLTAAKMLDLLDPVAGVRANGPVYRDFVNIGQLTEAGEYTGPGREAFLREWIAGGGRVLFVNASLHHEEPTYKDRATPAAVLDYVRYAGPQGEETMRRIARLIARLTPGEQAAVLAVETMNEPAIYDKAGRKLWGDTGLTALDFLDMFEADQAAIARAAIAAGIPDHLLILMPRYKYNADADSLTATNGRSNSILDRWLDEFGDRLGISTHMYAPWVAGSYTDDWLSNAKANLNKIPAHVPQVVTEANSSDFAATSGAMHHSGWTMAELSIATAVAFQYFPGANWGEGALLSTRFTPDRTNEPDRLFTWHDLIARTLRPGPLDVTLPIHVIRSPADPRHVAGDDDDRIRAWLRIIRMGDGDGEIVLSGPEAVMCYGGEGDQRVTLNRDEFSWFSGWTGHDTVDARDCPGAIVNLGQGEDVILLGGRSVTVNGRGGGDVFVLADSGNADVFGFSAGVDRIHPNGLSYTIGGKPLTITTAGGGTVTLHGQIGGKAITAVQASIIT